jgi:hypothetical protein
LFLSERESFIADLIRDIRRSIAGPIPRGNWIRRRSGLSGFPTSRLVAKMPPKSYLLPPTTPAKPFVAYKDLKSPALAELVDPKQGKDGRCGRSAKSLSWGIWRMAVGLEYTEN